MIDSHICFHEKIIIQHNIVAITFDLYVFFKRLKFCFRHKNIVNTETPGNFFSLGNCNDLTISDATTAKKKTYNNNNNEKKNNPACAT